MTDVKEILKNMTVSEKIGQLSPDDRDIERAKMVRNSL